MENFKQDTAYPLRIFLVWQGLVMLLLGITAGLGLLFVAASYLGEWVFNYGIAHLIVILSILGAYAFFYKMLTLRADFVIRADRFDIIYDEPKKWFQPDDRSIAWTDLKSYYSQPAVISANTISSPYIKINPKNKRGFYLYIAGNGTSYQQLTAHFDARVKAYNQSVAMPEKIRKNAEFGTSKAGLIFFTVIGLFFLGLGTVLGVSSGKWDIFTFFALFAFSLIFLGILARRRGIKQENSFLE